jgi:hypothetical protein
MLVLHQKKHNFQEYFIPQQVFDTARSVFGQVKWKKALAAIFENNRKPSMMSVGGLL